MVEVELPIVTSMMLLCWIRLRDRVIGVLGVCCFDEA